MTTGNTCLFDKMILHKNLDGMKLSRIFVSE